MLTYGQNTSQDVSYITSWDVTVLVSYIFDKDAFSVYDQQVSVSA